MLRRLPRANALFLDPRNAAHKAEIERAHNRNLPLIETLVREGAQDEGRHFVSIFRLYAPELVIPGRLPDTLLTFGDDVAIAWISSTAGERTGALRIASFGWGCNSQAFGFFGRDLEAVVHRAKPLARLMMEKTMKGMQPDEADQERLRRHLLEVARRLTVGFSPLL